MGTLGSTATKVLLVSTNRCQLTVPPFPLGLAYVAAAVERAGHEVTLWDSMFEADWREGLQRVIRDFGPDVIGLSVRNVDDQDIRNPHLLLEESREVAAACRRACDAVLVAGGAGFSMFATEALDYLGVDYGIIGEGERALNMLLEALRSGAGAQGVPGLVWREDGEVRRRNPRWIEAFDDVALPDRMGLDMASYYDSQGSAGIPNAVTVQTKRGCPLRCVYCATAALEGFGLRLRSPALVVDEIEGLVERGWRRVQFVDSVFTNPPHHAEAICEELLRRGVDLHWSCTINPAFAQPELLRLAKKAGCVLVMVGNESGSSRVLEALGKGFSREEVAGCFERCEAEGLRYNAFLLLGGPGEDRASVEESVALLESHHPNQVSVTVGIRVYPGCELAALAEKEGAIPAGVGLLQPTFYLSPDVCDWIWEYLEPVLRRNPHWVV